MAPIPKPQMSRIGKIDPGFVDALNGENALVENPLKNKARRISITCNVVIDTDTGEVLSMRPILTRMSTTKQWHFTTVKVAGDGLARLGIPTDEEMDQ